jgi:hypothetical protein
MPRITLSEYFMGRDARFADELTPRIRDCSALTVERANYLLEAYAEATGDDSERRVNSGWRPRAVNAAVRGAAPNSRHLTGEAVDLSDEDQSLGEWCESEAGLAVLEKVGLWIESPAYTKRWLHCQTVAPRSGNRVFVP